MLMGRFLGSAVRPARQVRIVALLREQGAASAVEFALVAPVVLALVAGTLEFSMLSLGNAMLHNAVAEAARVGMTTNGSTALREDRIREEVARYTSSFLDPRRIGVETLVYDSFANVGQPEPFTDHNGNGVWDPGEPFSDVNGNGQWDADRGTEGVGGPSDIVLYRITYDWQMWTPLVRNIVRPDGRIPLAATLAVRNEAFSGAGGA
jgi:Flp pilus assembly protein TadG